MLLVAEKLNKLYKWLEYDVKTEQFDLTVKMLSLTLKSEYRISQFFDLIAKGAFGMILKNPTSVTSAAYKFILKPDLYE